MGSFTVKMTQSLLGRTGEEWWLWQLPVSGVNCVHVVHNVSMFTLVTVRFVELSEEEGSSQPGVEGVSPSSEGTSVNTVDTAELLRIAREDDVKSELGFIVTEKQRGMGSWGIQCALYRRAAKIKQTRRRWLNVVRDGKADCFHSWCDKYILTDMQVCVHIA